MKRSLYCRPHVDWLAPRLPDWAKRAVKRYTRATGALRCLPDFLIIGARRCGTTSLYNYLAAHPHVLPALTKEVFYFNQRFDQGLYWYRGHFPTVGEKRFWAALRGAPILTGEATPSYLRDVRAAERVRAVLPDVKLLVMVRDPAEAVYSSYRFALKFGTLTRDARPFASVVDDELRALRAIPPELDGREQLLARSALELGRYLYTAQLEYWSAVLGRDRLFVVVFENLRDDPVATMDGVHHFLGLPAWRLKAYPRHNAAGNVSPRDDGTRRRLDEFFAPEVRRLGEFLGRELPWGEHRRRAEMAAQAPAAAGRGA